MSRKLFASNRTCWFLAASIVAILIFKYPFERSFYLCVGNSMPQGLYKVTPEKNALKGQVVAFDLPPVVMEIIGGRPWAIPGILKFVVGVAGDEYCVTDSTATINQQFFGPVFRSDSNGDPLPRFRGCGVVKAGEILIGANLTERSFDFRYFGPIPVDSISAVVEPLFVFGKK